MNLAPKLMRIKEITLEIGNIPLWISLNNPSIFTDIYGPFLSNREPTHSICYKKISRILGKIYEDPFFPIEVCEIAHLGECIKFRDPRGVYDILFFHNSNIAGYIFGSERQNHEFPKPNHLISTLIFFLKGKGIFLHAASGIFNNFGFAFCGPSNVGKSTIAKKWHEKGVEILCDERIIIAEDQRGLCVFGTPWPGDFSYVSNQSAPLKYLFLLANNGANIHRPSSYGEFLQYMMPLTYHRPWDIAFTDFVLSFLESIYKKVSIFWLNRSSVSDPDSFFSSIDKIAKAG